MSIIPPFNTPPHIPIPGIGPQHRGNEWIFPLTPSILKEQREAIENLQKQINELKIKMTDLTFNEYQIAARETAIYPQLGNNIVYPTLGLVGESGEVAEKVKKYLRDDGGSLSEQRRSDIIKECSDVFWYLAAMCSELNISMGEVAQINLDKLNSRKERGVLQGSGDNR